MKALNACVFDVAKKIVYQTPMCSVIIDDGSVIIAGILFASWRIAFLPKATFLALRLWERLLETDNAGSL